MSTHPLAAGLMCPALNTSPLTFQVFVSLELLFPRVSPKQLLWGPHCSLKDQITPQITWETFPIAPALSPDLGKGFFGA